LGLSFDASDPSERVVHHFSESEGDDLKATQPFAASGRAIERHLRYIASYDSLTGLCNRSHLQKLFEEALIEARLTGNKVAFILMDLDHFKDLNSTLGHQVGDAVLISLAQGIQSLLQSTDTVSRFGGDEFGLLLTGLSCEDDVRRIASRLLEAAATSVQRNSPKLYSSASLGIALFPDHGTDVGELMQNADIALYRAKAEGRGRVQIFRSQMRESLVERVDKLSSFRTALETGAIKPYYQPLIQLSDRRSYGFEALARWTLPGGDVLYPGHFQVALDDPNVVILLGEHMLQSISDDLRRWRGANMPACKVSINASGPELKQSDYPEKVANLFSSKGIPLSQLTIEITESVLLDDQASLIAQTLTDLRKLGVSISLDDFGTGFASLIHLKSYVIDQIKIDRAFIADLPSNTNGWAIVKATLGLARSLGIQTVAEGIENEAQLKCLQALGCDSVQGFFFSPAIPADQAETYFRENRTYKKARLHQFVLPALTQGS
jgi:diguanylate cyclase (GGDEF)-like protein